MFCIEKCSFCYKTHNYDYCFHWSRTKKKKSFTELKNRFADRTINNCNKQSFCIDNITTICLFFHRFTLIFDIFVCNFFLRFAFVSVFCFLEIFYFIESIQFDWLELSSRIGMIGLNLFVYAERVSSCLIFSVFFLLFTFRSHECVFFFFFFLYLGKRKHRWKFIFCIRIC